ncbi:MAG: winged helix-turn-helix transcriptional regulator [Acutalibacteraceae bacterium]
MKVLYKDVLITGTVYPVVPPKTEYNLTELGKSFVPVLNAMCEWGRDKIAHSH